MTDQPDLFTDVDPPESPPMAKLLKMMWHDDEHYVVYRCDQGHQIPRESDALLNELGCIDESSLSSEIVCAECLDERQRERGKP
jgi:hypothetical protein